MGLVKIRTCRSREEKPIEPFLFSPITVKSNRAFLIPKIKNKEVNAR